MQFKSIAECSKGSILQYFRPSLCLVTLTIKTFVLSIFERPLKTGFTLPVFVVVILQINTIEQNIALKAVKRLHQDVNWCKVILVYRNTITSLLTK